MMIDMKNMMMAMINMVMTDKTYDKYEYDYDCDEHGGEYHY